tara:strand:- start:3941 stop:5422 length:1482 start_codon:yes stop_codon:yes gene_type:complete
MATEIIQHPKYSNIPVEQPIIFSVLNEPIVDDTANSRVKYTATVHISAFEEVVPSSSFTEIGTFKTTPNNAGTGIFDFSNVIKDFVVADHNAGINSTYKLAQLSEAKIPIHIVDKWSSNTNSVRWFFVQFATEFLNSAGVTETVDIVNSDSFKIFNGYLKFTDVLVYGTGSPLEENSFGYNLTNFNLNSSSKKFLTNAPLVQYANIEDYGTSSILMIKSISNSGSGIAGAFTSPDDGVQNIEFNFYDKNDALIETEFIIISSEATGGATYADRGLAENKLFFTGVFPANLRNWSTKFNDNIDDISYYTYHINRLTENPDPASSFPINEKISDDYRININCPNLKGYKSIRLTWLNQWGTWDYYTFTMKSSKTIKTNGSTYNELSGTWNEQYYRINSFKGGKKTFKVNSTEMITMNTDFVNELESEWFEELMNSPEVYILDGFQIDSSNSVLNNYVIPVRLKNSSYTTKTVANDKLMQYNFEVEKSNTLRTQSV